MFGYGKPGETKDGAKDNHHDENDDENSDDDGNYDDENVCIDVIKNTLMIEMSGGGKTKATTQQTET